MGVPVVATALAEVRNLPGVTVAATASEFIAAVANATRPGNGAQMLRASVQGDSWEARVDRLLATTGLRPRWQRPTARRKQGRRLMRGNVLELVRVAIAEIDLPEPIVEIGSYQVPEPAVPVGPAPASSPASTSSAATRARVPASIGSRTCTRSRSPTAASARPDARDPRARRRSVARAAAGPSRAPRPEGFVVSQLVHGHAGARPSERLLALHAAGLRPAASRTCRRAASSCRDDPLFPHTVARSRARGGSGAVDSLQRIDPPCRASPGRSRRRSRRASRPTPFARSARAVARGERAKYPERHAARRLRPHPRAATRRSSACAPSSRPRRLRSRRQGRRTASAAPDADRARTRTRSRGEAARLSEASGGAGPRRALPVGRGGACPLVKSIHALANDRRLVALEVRREHLAEEPAREELHARRPPAARRTISSGWRPGSRRTRAGGRRCSRSTIEPTAHQERARQAEEVRRARDRSASRTSP